MKLCIDWETVHQDWLASGLSKNRYFLSGRIEKFIRKKSYGKSNYDAKFIDTSAK